MKISPSTRFPHPVLSSETGDFNDGIFEVRYRVNEEPTTGSLKLQYSIVLTNPEIKRLVDTSQAQVGCFVNCEDTYYAELIRFDWPSGQIDFTPGSLINTVTLLPLIWLNTDLTGWTHPSIHAEFAPPLDLKKGNIISIGEKLSYSVGMSKLKSLESIFELVKSSEINDDAIKVMLDSEKIIILVNEQIYSDIQLLRANSERLPIVMNAVYLPAVMEVVNALSEGPEQYENRRWYAPFTARCIHKEIDLSNIESVLEDSQILLDYPAGKLGKLLAEDSL